MGTKSQCFVCFKSKFWLDQKWFVSGWGIVAVAGDSGSVWDAFVRRLKIAPGLLVVDI